MKEVIKGWLKFEFYGMSKSGKTEVWSVLHKDKEELLGAIRWNGGWRQYIYEPEWSYYSKGCLRHVADFLEELMQKRKHL